MYTLGIDIGSASSKAVIVKDGGIVCAELAIPGGTGTSGQQRAQEGIFQTAGLAPDDIAFTVATGYGRFSVPEADKQISEITCHGKGIAHLRPHARTVIDIGGQDAKAILLDERGNIVKFFMNDKCAAGTGRFLEGMARVLEVGLDEMEACHRAATSPATVSSTCAVFAESEVISLLSRGFARNDIIAGVHDAVATRACALAYRAGVVDDVVMCGGVARNGGVVEAISRKLGHPVEVAPHPQVTGALGAALLAYEEARRSEVSR